MSAQREAYYEPAAHGVRAIDVWSLVLRHIVLICFTSAAGVGVGYLIFLRTIPVFQSRCSLLVQNESKNQTMPFQGNDGSLSGSNLNDQPHALLIVTPMIVGRALELDSPVVAKPKDAKPIGGRSSFVDEPSGTSEQVETPAEAQSPKLKDLPAFANVGNATQHILAHLTAKSAQQGTPGSTDIINLAYSGDDPLTCRRVLEAVVRSYENFLGESHKTGSGEVLRLIEEAQNRLTGELKKTEADYIEFRQENPLLFHGETKLKNLHQDRLAEIEQARARLIISVTERRAELQSITDALQRGGSRDALTLMLKSMKADHRGREDGVNSPAMEIFELMLSEQLLLQDVGPEHPKVRTIRKKIALLQEHYASELSSSELANKYRRADFLTLYMDSLSHEISSVDSKIMELDELFESERHASKAIAVYEVRNENFKKHLERTGLLYDRVVKRLDELNLLQDFGGYKTDVIAPATLGSQVAPSFSKSLLIGAVLGAAIGFGLGYLAEASDKTFRTPEEVSSHLHLPIVGHIPVIERERHDLSVDNSRSKLDRTLVTFFKPKSRLSESYRAIRTSLYFSTRGERHKVIQVTSPNPGDGKTTLSANLAISIAQSGKRVLLIDADFRRPRIHDLFSLSKSIGMSSVINGEAELPDAIQATEVENLWALACGARPNNPCELLTSPRFEELLEVLSEQYDFVIIDTPPLLAVTDPSAVAARVDAVLLTIRLSKRTRGEATKATELLSSIAANVLGVVVNGISNSGSGGYGYGYGFMDQYGSYKYRAEYEYGGKGDDPYYADVDSDAERSNVKRKASLGRKKV